MEKSEIKFGCVYSNADGETRLAVSVSHGGRVSSSPSLVKWQTNNPELDPAQKCYGSCTVATFAKWAVSVRAGTTEDWAAFETVKNRRSWRASDKKAVRRIRRNMQLQGGGSA